jgi:aromatic ring-opening dioxygenase LigB subunit
VIADEELIDMIRASATEQLPIAVMTVKEMRQFAEKVALDCISMIGDVNIYREDILSAIRKKYVIEK